MGHRTGRLFRSALVCAALALAAALGVPTLAFAADAKFYTRTPAPSSTVATISPRVSVYIIDRYGIKGSSNVRLYIDGVRRYPRITYRIRYKRLTLTYQTSKLRVTRHKVTLKVKNVRGHWSTTYWYFTVPDLTPVRPPMPVTIESTECSSCHLGFPATHPTTDCGLCHGTGRPVPGVAYGPSSTSAHTLLCALQACHRSATVFPHVVGADCTTCHAGTYPGIVASHDASDAVPPHLTSDTWCAKPGCHDVSLTVEHYRWSIDGAKLTCATCHASRDARVIATLRAGSTACEGCHDLAVAHTASTTAHTLPATPSCVASACHTGGTNVATIHAPLGGCADCHATGKTPSLVCTSCHVSDGHPPHAASPAPAAIKIGGVDFGTHACAECHAVGDLRVLHGGASGCAKCHPTAANSVKPWGGGCIQGACHRVGTTSAVHATIDVAHVLPTAPACTATGCHAGGRNVASIHAAGPGCLACHASGVTPSVVCSTVGCHDAGVTAKHSSHPSVVSSMTVTVLGTSYGTHACAECHKSTDLQAAHGGASSCAKCHPAPRSSFSVWNGTCVQGGCHGPGTALALHGNVDAAHTAAAASECTLSGCHAGGTDVTRIHAAVAGRTDSGCGICHARAAGPTLVCGTAGCHAANTTSLHASHPATITSGTISINGTNYGKHLCSECHTTTELQAAHGGTSSCAKCHPSPRGSITTWSGGCVQGDCHKSGTALAMHGGADSAHTTSAAAACTVSSCHTGGSDVAVIHTAAGGCPVCHGAGKTPTPVCATAGCHSTATTAKHSSHPATVTSATITILGANYGKHLCAECHATTDLQVVHGGPTSCSKCHPAPRNSFTLYGGGCVQGTCHKTGTTLAMHGSIDATHTAPAGACVKSGCHGSNVAALHAPGPGCVACHASGKTLTLACGTVGCHTSDPHPAHTSTVASMTITIGGVSFGKHLCAECHAVPDLRNLHGGTSGCSTCHPSPRNTFTSWNTTCVQGGCHAPASASSLHANIDAGHTAPTGTCVKSGCHGANVAVLHAQGPGCIACHAVGRTPTIVCSAGGCHPTGASPIHAAHPARITSATITINGASYGNHFCSECHATTELQAVHGGGVNCSKCHPAPRNSFTNYGGGCVQGTCHSAGTTLAMHGSIDASHTATAAASCTISGCHTGGTDVAKIHAAGAGCATCHAAGKAPTLVCTTAGCHPTGASPMHTAHPTTITSSTITINGVNYGKHLCTECHAPMELQGLHGGSTSCAKCHPTPRDTIITYTGGCSQGQCHSTTSGRRTHAAVDTGHLTATQPSCTTGSCHAGGSDVAKIHYLKGGCGACHGVNKTPTLVCATCHAGDLKAIHTSYIGTKHDIALGSCVTSACHTAADAATLHEDGLGCIDCHATGVTPSLVCANCHAGNATTVHAPYIGTKHTVDRPSCQAPVCHGSDAANLHPRTGCTACHAESKTPSLECSSCHTASVVTLHPTGTVGHTVNQHPCTGSSCHGGNAATTHAHSDSNCMACHTNTDGTADTNACYVGSAGGCHPLPWATRHSNYAITSDYHGAAVGDGTGGGMYESLGWILPPYTRGANLACSVCHDTAGTSNIHEIKTTINGRAVTVTNGYQLVNACVACHGGTVNDWHQGCIDCHSGGMGGANARDFNGKDCSVCHQHGMLGWQHGQFVTTGPTM